MGTPNGPGISMTDGCARHIRAQRAAIRTTTRIESVNDTEMVPSEADYNDTVQRPHSCGTVGWAMPVLTLAHSPDPDDAFMWWPLTGKIEPPHEPWTDSASVKHARQVGPPP